MQLQDVAVLITGGGSGLGAATARAMAAKGAKIGVIDQNKENAEKVAAEVKGVALHADVTDEEAIKAAIAKAEAAHGIARVLMNCAGIGGSQRVVGKDGVYPLAKFVRIINVNLIGTFNVLRLFAERLATAPPIGEERGVAINTASVAAYEGQIGQIAYSASKGGVVGLTLPAARDLASLKIRVNTIAPGLFLTPLLMGLNEEARKSLGAQVPHPARLGDASEYGNLAVHIVENPMLNGETIRLDGAIRMAPRELSFSPCGRRWREAPDEGCSPQRIVFRGANPSLNRMYGAAGDALSHKGRGRSNWHRVRGCRSTT
jgi:NAD(P)-dependent dehydrogenase (short-subunit alcohol dehydrogenase family)